jgi:hypothetical protein
MVGPPPVDKELQCRRHVKLTRARRQLIRFRVPLTLQAPQPASGARREVSPCATHTARRLRPFVCGNGEAAVIA